MLKLYRLIGCLLVVAILPSCSHRRIIKNPAYKYYLQESIARLSMIPDVPLGVSIKEIVKEEDNPDSVQIFCNYGSLVMQDLKSFYIEEMERLGWILKAEHEGVEVVLCFAKPSDDICIISVRTHRQLVITLLTKKEAP